MNRPKRYLVVADSDSRLHWALKTGRALAGGGYQGEVVLLRSPSNPSPRQMAGLGLAGVPDRVDFAELCKLDRLGPYDAVVLGLMGPDLGRLLHRLRQDVERARPARRPLLVSGYWGITGVRDVEGLLWRLGCDLICCNNIRDRDLFSGILADCARDPAMLVPAGFLHEGAAENPAAGQRIETVVFVGQPNLPRTRYAKAYLLHQLVDYAERHPTRRLIVKPRMQPGEKATHREGFSLESLCRERREPLPANLRFDYGPLGAALDRADLVLTISSAVAIDAWLQGRRVALIADFGIDEKLANPFFVGSDAFASFADIAGDRLPQVNQGWLTRHAMSPGFGPERIVEAVDRLLQRQAEAGRALPMPAPCFTEQTHPLAFGKVDIRRYHRARLLPLLGNVLRRVMVYWDDRAEFFE